MYIEKLKGTYEALVPSGIILDVDGVGYGLEMPLSSICELPELNSPVSLWTYTHVREDSIRLFGFTKYEDRVCFEVMLSLSGVGPKVALAILSTLSISALRRAIQLNDPQILVAVPGVGPRLAEKILVELKPKLEKLSGRGDLGLKGDVGRLTERDLDHLLPEESFEARDAKSIVLQDVTSALENLGFKDKAISPIVTELKSFEGLANFQETMKEALRLLTDQGRGEKASSRKQKKSMSTVSNRELF